MKAGEYEMPGGTGGSEQPEEYGADVISRRSPYEVGETVRRLRLLLDEAGVELFAHINHAEAARDAGLPLRETQVLLFGSPRSTVPLMVEAPLLALELPLKVLVWQDDEDRTWVSHQEPDSVRARYGLPADLIGPLAAPATLIERVVTGA
jgi:uncharacterized protein (DUF302 family)